MIDNRYELIHYLIAYTDHKECEWCYRAEDLEKELNEVCRNQRLNKVYVSLVGYYDAFAYHKNKIDLTYMGGPSLLIFDKCAIELDIWGEGLIKYRIIPIWDIRIKHRFDRFPEDMYSEDNYFYDASETIYLKYEQGIVESVAVESTGTYSFEAKGINTELLHMSSESHQLPNNIIFNLDNGKSISFIADYIENYFFEVNER